MKTTAEAAARYKLPSRGELLEMHERFTLELGDNLILRTILCALLLLPHGLAAHSLGLQFTLHKKGTPDGPTLLVIGGIQGDEPGGFTAASLIVTDYEITSGNVWVVPNLNFESIVRSARGVHGDMNRKFHHIHASDPEYEAVQDIKRLILDPRVDMVLNLHDGSGFYRGEHIDEQQNPHRWGQSIVIDQESIGSSGMRRLGDVARRIVMRVNRTIREPQHYYHIKNTRTKEGNTEMAKTLTYFAIRNGRPAAGVESSKTLLTDRRASYHLGIIEGYMDELGIGFERGFALTADGVRRQFDGNLRLALYDRIYLDVADARKRVGHVPMKKDAPLQFTASNPLVAIIDDDHYFRVSHGNRRVTQLHPEYFDYDAGIDSLAMRIDGRPVHVPASSMVDAYEEILIEPIEGYRVNAIGFKRDGVANETGIAIRRTDFMPRFSIDEGKRLFRVEVYRGEKFSGMVLVRFVDRPVHPARTHQELISGDVDSPASDG